MKLTKKIKALSFRAKLTLAALVAIVFGLGSAAYESTRDAYRLNEVGQIVLIEAGPVEKGQKKIKERFIHVGSGLFVANQENSDVYTIKKGVVPFKVAIPAKKALLSRKIIANALMLEGTIDLSQFNTLSGERMLAEAGHQAFTSPLALLLEVYGEAGRDMDTSRLTEFFNQKLKPLIKKEFEIRDAKISITSIHEISVEQGEEEAQFEGFLTKVVPEKWFDQDMFARVWWKCCLLASAMMALFLILANTPLGRALGEFFLPWM